MRLWNLYHREIPDFLAEAAETPALQRLQDVGMNCGCEYTGFPLFSGLAPYSRFDHSMGVALIVWHFTGDRHQAMSGLLHDIASPVFAHVVDFLHGDHMTQESTEAGTADMIQTSPELCRVLEKYSLSPEAVSDYHLYPIADNDSPRLCADRLEYTLGNAVNYGILKTEQAAYIYGDLTAGTNEYGQPELIFQHPEAARTFALAALECSRIYVSEPDRYAMECLARLLKEAIKKGILSEQDLHGREQAVIGKLKGSSLSDQWIQFHNFSQIIRRSSPGTDGTWLQIHAKKRTIDPCIADLGRASEAFPAFSAQLNQFREETQDAWLCAI